MSRNGNITSFHESLVIYHGDKGENYHEIAQLLALIAPDIAYKEDKKEDRVELKKRRGQRFLR